MISPPAGIRAALFDLDDTLNDRTMSWMSFVQLMARPGVDLIDPLNIEAVHARIVAADRGGYRPKSELFDELSDVLALRKPLEPSDFEALWRERIPECMVARAGALEVLGALRNRGLVIGIVTNGQAVTQTRKIEALGIKPMIDFVLISESAGVKKPDPRIFEMALRHSGTEAAETLFVGDDPQRDVFGSARVGMQTAWIRLGRDWPGGMARPTYSIAKLPELLNIIAG
jgi:putative hydrolase of the HAD superfamily